MHLFLANEYKITKIFLLFLLFLLGFNYYSSLKYVPFHPDESTYIYMSSDFLQLLTDPREMVFKPDIQSDLKQHYRLIDPPLTRYVIGAGLSLAGITGISSDWNWELTWDENIKSGAMPDSKMLIISRVAVSCFFLLSLYAVYKLGFQLRNPLTGLLAVILIGGNALILLHTRRAMEESLLLLGICLSLWSFSYINKRPWLAGLAVLLALNTKISAIPLYFTGLVAIICLDNTHTISWSKKFYNFILYTSILLIGTYVLNPIAWYHPWSIIQISIHERIELVSAQLSSLQIIDPAHALTSPGARIAGILTHTFFSRPAILDIGNYMEQLQPATTTYLTLPGTSLLRGYIGGLIVFFLTLFGIVLMLTGLIIHRINQNRFCLMFMLGFLFFIIPMSIANTLPFQRYVIPLIPFTSLFTAFGISQVIHPNKKAPD